MIFNCNEYLKPKTEQDVINDLSKLSKKELNKTLLKYSEYGPASVIQYLIDAGADVNYIDHYYNWSPLLASSCSGNKSIVEILLKSGANVNVRTNADRTPLQLASMHKHKEVIKLLKKYGAKKINDY